LTTNRKNGLMRNSASVSEIALVPEHELGVAAEDDDQQDQGRCLPQPEQQHMRDAGVDVKQPGDLALRSTRPTLGAELLQPPVSRPQHSGDSRLPAPGREPNWRS
jgi:hypothetical protein